MPYILPAPCGSPPVEQVPGAGCGQGPQGSEGYHLGSDGPPGNLSLLLRTSACALVAASCLALPRRALSLDQAKRTSFTRGSHLESCPAIKDTQPVQDTSCRVDQLSDPGHPSGQPGQCASSECIVQEQLLPLHRQLLVQQLSQEVCHRPAQDRAPEDGEPALSVAEVGPGTPGNKKRAGGSGCGGDGEED